MNIELLRKSLKVKWLDYYRENRQWLVRLGVWVNCDGQRRPASSFILATVSILEPRLTQIFPLIVELSNNPDRVVAALGLNFNPDVELKMLSNDENATGETDSEESAKMLPSGTGEVNVSPASQASNLHSLIDESCRGVNRERD